MGFGVQYSGLGVYPREHRSGLEARRPRGCQFWQRGGRRTPTRLVFIVQCLVFIVHNLWFGVLGSVFFLSSVGGLPPRVFRFSWGVTPAGAAQVVRLH